MMVVSMPEYTVFFDKREHCICRKPRMSPNPLPEYLLRSIFAFAVAVFNRFVTYQTGESGLQSSIIMSAAQ